MTPGGCIARCSPDGICQLLRKKQCPTRAPFLRCDPPLYAKRSRPPQSSPPKKSASNGEGISSPIYSYTQQSPNASRRGFTEESTTNHQLIHRTNRSKNFRIWEAFSQGLTWIGVFGLENMPHGVFSVARALKPPPSPFSAVGAVLSLSSRTMGYFDVHSCVVGGGRQRV